MPSNKDRRVFADVDIIVPPSWWYDEHPPNKLAGDGSALIDPYASAMRRDTANITDYYTFKEWHVRWKPLLRLRKSE